MFEPTERKNWLDRITVRTAIGAAFVLTFLGLVLVGYYYSVVRASSEKVRYALSDNVTWTVVQIEIDFQNLRFALSQALISAQGGNKPDLDSVIRAFDIYYSRTNAIKSVYNTVAGSASTGPGRVLDRINLEKVKIAELLDKWNDPSNEEISDLLEIVNQSDADVRRFTTQMLEVLVADASAERLGQLSILSHFGVLLVLIVGLLFSMLSVSIFLLRRFQTKAATSSSIADTLRSIIEASQDAVVISDSFGTILEYNESAKNIFGYTSAEAIGCTMADLFIPDSLRTAHQDGMKKYMNTRQSTIVGNGRHIMTACNKSGTKFPVEVTISTSKDRVGDIIFIGILRDISARIAKDKELKSALEKAKRDATAKERFLAVMSHEMRTPLQGILATFDLLEHEVTNASQESLIELGKLSGTKALDQVNKTLDLVRLDEGSPLDLVEVLDPVESLRNLIRRLQPLIYQRSNTVELEYIGKSGLKVIGSQYLFDALFDNLLANANKFTQHGHISVTIMTNDISENQMELEILVRDTGIGIAAADCLTIFEDFVTSDSTYTRSQDGTGLGLGIVKRCSEKMGGTVTVESELGVGSIFRFLCVFDAATDCLSSASRNLDISVADRRETAPDTVPLVLVVEDNRTNQTLIGKMLERLGCHYEYAGDGLNAIQMTTQKSYDLILMDLSMPNLDGFATVQLIRQICRPQENIVCITAHSAADLLSSVLDAGMTELMPKPIRFAALADLIARTVFSSDENKPRELLHSQATIAACFDPISELLEIFGLEQLQAFLEDFDRKLRGDLKEIKKLLLAGDDRVAADLLHGSAGGASMIGAHQISVLLSFLEDLARAGQLKPHEPLLETCYDFLDTFEIRVNALAQGYT